MAFVPTPQTASVSLRYTAANQLLENTLYFFKDDGQWDVSSLAELTEDVETWWLTTHRAVTCNIVEYREIVATDISTEAGVQVTRSTVPTPIGLIEQPHLPLNVTIALSFRTNQRGRSFRGRNYWPALGEGQVSGNNLNPATATQFVDAYFQLVAPAPALRPGFTWVALSRYSDGQPRAEGLATLITNVLLTDTIIDSQRRRLPGRGQ